ncbi:MAG: hypothetical protein HETSPECPRED_001816 [Heterodermia speciosa]|uniref:Uncharacterized protein n=1 Tax=Heterodermia speciosa TaxID=116794 RepID=A0A8H3PG09_9LECA|nr:MAG: hypothetical protein HETSPECPRED_001816 [Heterodermia speciosa]
MADSSQDTLPKADDAPESRDHGGTTVPKDDASVNLAAPMAPHAPQGPTRDPLEVSPGQSDLLPPMAPDSVAQAHQVIFNTGACALPPALLAEQIAYNYPGTMRPPLTPAPYTSPAPPIAATSQATAAPKKAYRKTPISEMTAEEKEARQTLLTASEQDRAVFLNFLKEPNHGGLAPDRVAALQRAFKHYTLSSYPGSVSGIEANKKARREGLAEIAHLKALKASGLQEGSGDLSGVHGGEIVGLSVPEEDKGVDAPENTGEGAGRAESEDRGTDDGSQERVSDGITLSYSLNGRDCTKEELDSTHRYPHHGPPQEPEVGPQIPIAEYLQQQQPSPFQQYAQQMQQQQFEQQMQNQQYAQQAEQMHFEQMQGQSPWDAPPYPGQYPGYPPFPWP